MFHRFTYPAALLQVAIFQAGLIQRGLTKAALRHGKPAILGIMMSIAVAPMVSQADEIGSTAERARREFMHHRVMWMHNPQHEAVVSWSTSKPGNVHQVFYDTQPRGGNPQAYAESLKPFRSAAYTTFDGDKGTPPAFYHHVHLNDLEPSTTVYFVIQSDQHVSREYHFFTASDQHESVKVISGGDSRRPPDLPAVHETRRQINQMIAEMAEKDPEILAFCHGGDYCTRALWRYMSDWLSDHELTITSKGRILPIIPTRGNHDMDIVFEEMFMWPNRDHKYYYSIKLSDSVFIITLNTEISMAGDQRNWLAKELPILREQPDRTLMVQYHRPAYGSVKSFEQGARQRQYWVPLFETYQVDLVAESDHHSLKRTLPIFQDKHDPERGITYIGDGGLGVPIRTVDSKRWYLQSPGMTAEAVHVHLIELGDDRVSGRAIGLDRETLDSFLIESKEFATAP